MTKRMDIDWQEDKKDLLEMYKWEQDVELRIRWHAFWLGCDHYLFGLVSRRKCQGRKQ